jgi:uncharacterized protein with von Willebrand factor type A (vWA) domain
VSGQLVHNLLLFGRTLRAAGLDVNPGGMLDLVGALAHVSIGRRHDFYHAARSLLVHRREDVPLFDEVFEAFWRKPAAGATTLDLRAMGEKRRYRPSFEPLPQGSGAGRGAGKGAPDEAAPVLRATLSYSAQELLRHKDFAKLTRGELEQVEAMLRGFVWRLRARRSRRRRPGRGGVLDLRRTLRRNLRHGGELLEWASRAPRLRPRPLVILADISGSMERYTRLLLLFSYGLAEGLERRVEAFVFGTRLTRITRELRGRDLERALRDVSRAVPDWSGGTRIGEALRRFNFQWARRVLGGGAVVLLISDGWDRGDAALLRDEMARLQRSARRLIWLNPLLGAPEYEPLARGMRTALPYVDDFLPVHDLASLEDLAGRLERLPERRPGRRQHAAAREVAAG